MKDRQTAGYYDLAFGGMTEDRDLYVALAREEGGPVCELGAGTGRVALAIARAGVAVAGVDVSEPMLERFRAKLAGESEEVRGRVEVVAGDMRSWGPDGRFAQIFIPFRAFLAMLTREERHRCLVNCHRILRPGGRLVLNLFHPSIRFMRRYLFEQEGMSFDVGSWATPEGGTLELSETSRFDTVQQRIHTRFRWTERRPDGSVRLAEQDHELAYVWRDELWLHLEAAGFEVENLWGGFDRRPLSEEGQEMVAVARKAG